MFSSEARANGPAEQEAAGLYDEATIRYETADYRGAVELFRQAYAAAASIPDEKKRANIMNTLRYNIARALVQRHNQDQDAVHLHQAKELLQTYMAAGTELGDELDGEALLTRVRVLLGEEPETSGAAAPPPSLGRTVTRSSEPAGPPPPTTVDPLPADEPAPAPAEPRAPARPGTALLAIGGVAAGGSIVGFALLGAGAARAKQAEADFVAAANASGRYDADLQGQLGNQLVIIGAVTAGALLTTAAVLIVIGARKRSASNTAVARLIPNASPTQVGLQLAGTF